MNENFMNVANASILYLIVLLVLLFIVVMCFVFIFKSYNTGLAIGMERVKLKRAIVSSIGFTVLPSISILLGVVALSGNLGVPISWLRLSVIGALQYELNVAEIAATSMGMSGLVFDEMTIGNFGGIILVMTLGISAGVVISIIFNKKYQEKLKSRTIKKKSSKKGFQDYVTIAMFIGLCSAYIGSYIGEATNFSNYMPIFVALTSGIIMYVFELLINKYNLKFLENFSLATSMLIAMILAVIVSL